MEETSNPFDSVDFVRQWASFLKNRAELFASFFSDILTVASDTSDNRFCLICDSTNPVFWWREQIKRRLAEGEAPFFPGENIPEKEVAKALCQAIEAAGINHDPGPEIILSPNTVRAYENNASPPLNMEEPLPLMPGDAVRILFPAWYQGGKLLYKGLCQRLYSLCAGETAVIRFEAYHEFSRDYYRRIGPNRTWIDFSFLSSPDKKYDMDLEINNPDDNPSVFQYDLPPGTILQALLWVLLRGETKITVWDGQNAFPADGGKPENFYESVLFGMLTRVNREEQTFVLFAEHCGYVHCNWMKSDPLPPEVPLGSMVRVLSSDTDSYIDPYNSLYAAYPPHPHTACALYELRCQADQVKKSFAAHKGL